MVYMWSIKIYVNVRFINISIKVGKISQIETFKIKIK